jgi:hydrogenase 3 maturation protease
MQSLGEQLQSLEGRICLMCVGNADGGDDALGVRLGEELAGELAGTDTAEIVIAGTEPERFLFRGACDGYDHLVFVDAVDFGDEPGSVVLLNTREISGRFPQVSTHRLSLGLLAQWVEARGNTRAWLLGVQPQSLEPGRELSPGVQAALAMLVVVLKHRFNAGVAVC